MFLFCDSPKLTEILGSPPLTSHGKSSTTLPAKTGKTNGVSWTLTAISRKASQFRIAAVNRCRHRTLIEQQQTDGWRVFSPTLFMFSFPFRLSHTKCFSCMMAWRWRAFFFFTYCWKIYLDSRHSSPIIMAAAARQGRGRCIFPLSHHSDTTPPTDRSITRASFSQQMSSPNQLHARITDPSSLYKSLSLSGLGGLFSVLHFLLGSAAFLNPSPTAFWPCKAWTGSFSCLRPGFFSLFVLFFIYP